MINIRQVQYILTILEEGSVTAAAKKLYISQPSLSQNVKQVEGLLGGPLFVKSADAITLTPAGKKYIETALQVMELERNLECELKEMQHKDCGEIHIGLPVQRSLQILPSVLPAFRKLHPHITLKLEEYGSGTVEKMLKEGMIELGCVTTTPSNESFEYVHIEDEEIVILAGRGSEAAKRIEEGAWISVKDIRSTPLVSLTQGHNVREIQNRIYTQNHIEPNILLETTSMELAKRAVVTCDAVMIIPYVYAAMSPHIMEQCKIFHIKDDYRTRSFYVCYRKTQYVPQYMKDLIQVIQECAEKAQTAMELKLLQTKEE